MSRILVVGMGPRNRSSSKPDAPPDEADVGSEYEHTNFDPVHAQIFGTLGLSEDAKFDASLHISKTRLFADPLTFSR